MVFQLGYDQICIHYPESNRIALIAWGKGPVVVRPKKLLSESLGTGHFRT